MTRVIGGFVLDRVRVTHGRATILDEISAHVPAGRCTAVIGPSGSGKSTLLRLLNRLVDPTTGRVLLDGRPLSDVDVLALRRRVGLIGQHPVLLTDRVAAEVRFARPELPEDQVADLLARVGFAARFGQRHTDGLSGGEAQRLCLARALATGPEVLLLDEPTSALDGVNVGIIADLARQHVSAGGTAVLVSHDLSLVREVADRVLVLDHGRLIATGHPREIDYLEAQ